MKKRLFFVSIIALIVLISFGLMGCGGGSDCPDCTCNYAEEDPGLPGAIGDYVISGATASQVNSDIYYGGDFDGEKATFTSTLDFTLVASGTGEIASGTNCATITHDIGVIPDWSIAISSETDAQACSIYEYGVSAATITFCYCEAGTPTADRDFSWLAGKNL